MFQIFILALQSIGLALPAIIVFLKSAVLGKTLAPSCGFIWVMATLIWF